MKTQLEVSVGLIPAAPLPIIFLGVVASLALLSASFWWSARYRARTLNQEVDKAISLLLTWTSERHRLVPELCQHAARILNSPHLFAAIECRRVESERALDRCLNGRRSNKELKSLAQAEIELREDLALLLESLGFETGDPDPRDLPERGDERREEKRSLDRIDDHRLQAAIKELQKINSHFSFAAQAYNNALAGAEEHQRTLWGSMTASGPVFRRQFIDWEPEPSDNSR